MSTPGRRLLLALAMLGFVEQPDLVGQDTIVSVDTATLNARVQTAVDSALARQQQKSDSQGAAIPLVLTIGVEGSNAGGFDETKLSPAIGVSFLAGASDWNTGSLVTTELALQAQFTQGASVRSFASCHRLPSQFSEGAESPGERGCAPVETINDTIYNTILRRDSTRFQTVGVWRAFVQGRLEFRAHLTDRLRFGPILGAGIQSNPNDLAHPTQQQLKILGALGLGIRRIEESNIESFSLDVVYGAVQNYEQRDRLGPLGPDGRRDVLLDPLPARRTRQWQAYVSLRPMADFRIRGMFTFGAPDAEPGHLPIPDLARVAFMTDRNLAQIIKALVGGGGGTAGTQPRRPSAPL